MTTRDVSFLKDIKKGDEVYLVTSNYVGRKFGKAAFVVSRGSKWVTVSTTISGRGDRFDIRNGLGEGDCGYRSELWASEADWQADVQRKRVWSEFRDAVNAQYNPPEDLSVENIKKMGELLNGRG